MNTINSLTSLGTSIMRHNVRIAQLFGLLVGTYNNTPETPVRKEMFATICTP